MRKLRIVGLLVLFLIIYPIIGYAIYVNIANKPDVNFNPPETDTFRRYVLIYPRSHNGIILGTVNQTIVEVNVTAKGSIVEGKPVIIQSIGSASHPQDSLIKSVSVFFEGAVPYQVVDYKSGLFITTTLDFGGVNLTPNTKCPTHPSGVTLDTILCGSDNKIIFPNAGTYYPSILVSLKNGQNFTERYSDFFVPVISMDREMSAQYNRVNIAFSVALIIFAFMEGIVIVMNLTEEKKISQQYSDYTPPQNQTKNKSKK